MNNLRQVRIGVLAWTEDHDAASTALAFPGYNWTIDDHSRFAHRRRGAWEGTNVVCFDGHAQWRRRQDIVDLTARDAGARRLPWDKRGADPVAFSNLRTENPHWWQPRRELTGLGSQTGGGGERS